MTGQIGSIVPTIFIALLLAAGLAVTSEIPAQAADECLAAPNAPSPKGSHWFYRVDRPKNRKCWYLRPQDRAAQSAAPQPTSQMKRLAEATPAGESSAKPAAAEQPVAWPAVMLSNRREVETAVQTLDPPVPAQNVDRQRIGRSMPTMQATLASNETNVQPETPLDSLALATTPVQDPATITPLRVLLLVVGLLIVPGILLRLIFKFGASTPRRVDAGRYGKKRSDRFARKWLPAAFHPMEVPPLAPIEPADQTVAVEQLLRKILWELDRGATRPLPDPMNGGSRR